ncbi:MAG: DUF4290 domain-containing protein [Paludibacteraceae bacterium]|nr:DUF4290 domain-containing protein [Paludibacteraceae bacterium]MBR4705107.1 DUF4290 domain-containing protein [Paludibacteraceae bacterium]
MELHRQTTPIRMRNYGRIVQDMIAYAASMPAGVERDSMELYIAQCMRQRNLVWNRDQDAGLLRVREDIQRLSDGKLRCDSPAFQQMMAQPNAPLNGHKKKK